MIRRALVFVAALVAAPSLSLAQSSDPATQRRLDDLEAQVRALTDEVQRLRARPAAAPTAQPAGDAHTQELERKVDALAEEVTSRRTGVSFGGPLESRYGLGPAASKVYSTEKGVSLGGYGEVLWQGFDSTRDDGARSGMKDTLDTLRAVLYFGYKFSDHVVFNSEIEFEHANTEREGEVEVEFANVDFLLHDAFNVRAGMQLLPLGLTNEMHEPTTFWSARRPMVETVIIPSTWSDDGVGVFGSKGLFSYRACVVNGLDASFFEAGSGIREGRQGGSEALSEDFAVAARTDVTPVAGLTFGLSGYAGNAGQDAVVAGKEIDVPVSLWDAHLAWQWKGFGLRALYSRVHVGDVDDVNALLGLVGDESIGSRMRGWYAEAGFDVLSRLDTEQELTPFVRYESFDTQAAVPAGFARDPENDRSIWSCGFAYKPHPQVVIKVDYQDDDNAAGTAVDQFNAAVGYSF